MPSKSLVIFIVPFPWRVDAIQEDLSVHILPMADLENSDFMPLVIDEIDNSVLALPYPIAVNVSRKLL